MCYDLSSVELAADMVQPCHRGGCAGGQFAAAVGVGAALLGHEGLELLLVDGPDFDDVPAHLRQPVRDALHVGDGAGGEGKRP